MAEPLPVEAPAGFSAELGRRPRRPGPPTSRRMESAILQEVPRYTAEPARYRQAVFQRCRLATRMFLRILTTGEPPGHREITVVQGIARAMAEEGEPLEPLLHALPLPPRPPGRPAPADASAGSPGLRVHRPAQLPDRRGLRYPGRGERAGPG